MRVSSGQIMAFAVLHYILLICIIKGAHAQVMRSSRVANLSAEAVIKISSALLYHIQADKLSSLPGNVLGAMARNHKDDAVLVGKCALAARTSEQKLEFFTALKGTVLLPEMVQRELASYLVHWFNDLDNDWTFERFSESILTGTPLLAYIPREFLYSINSSDRVKFLYHLRNWKTLYNRELEWSLKPRGVQRIWAETLVNATFPVPLDEMTEHQIFIQGFLLSGCTPRELSHMKLKVPETRDAVLKIPFDHLQARMVFRTAFPRRPNRSNLKNKSKTTPVPAQQAKSIIELLTPPQIRRLDFSGINVTELASAPAMSSQKPSWASARQLVMSLAEHAEHGWHVTNAHDTSTWGIQGFLHVAKWAFSLPSATLQRMIDANPNMLNEALGRGVVEPQLIRALDESPLSPRQARILLWHQLGSAVECADEEGATLTVQGAARKLKGRLLQALPATCVATAPASISQDSLTRLMTHLPADSPALFPLYLKTWSVLNREWVLDAMLENPEVNGMLRLLGSSEVAPIVKEFQQALARRAATTPLPRRTMSIVLGYWRVTLEATGHDWRGQMFRERSLLSGLRCNDLYVLGHEDALPVLAALGSYLQQEGERYPRDLQHCGLKALLEYGKYRAKLQELSYYGPVIDIFEPAELDAVGGYILAQLPISLVRESDSWQHIIHNIGRLSIIELLEIFGPDHQSGARNKGGEALAHLALSRLEPRAAGLATLELLGNLLQFVPYAEHLAVRLDKRAFRLWLEGLERPEDTALCVPQSIKSSFWYRMSIEAYGRPSQWDAGTLVNLGGILVSLSEKTLDEIPESSWTEAADVLNSQSGYNAHFMKLCTRYLGPAESPQFISSTKHLLQRFLAASQNLSSTVRSSRDSSSLGAPTTTPSPAHGLRLSGGIVPVRPDFQVFKAREERAAEHQKTALDSLTNSVTDGIGHVENVSNITQINISKPAKIEEYKLSCGALRMAPNAASLLLDEHAIRGLVAAGDFEECLEYLGTLDLSAVTISVVWAIIKERGLQVEVRDMGKLLSQADLPVLRAAQLSDLDTVTIIGRHMDNWDQVAEMAMLVLQEHNATEHLLPHLAGALGTLTCGLFEEDLEFGLNLLRAEIFMKEVSLLTEILGRTSRCPPQHCLRGLIKVALSPLAFSDVSRWSAEDVTALGVIAAGLMPQQIEELNPGRGEGGAAAGLTMDAIRCMSDENMNALTASQLAALPLSSLDAIRKNQVNELLPDLREALRTALAPPLPPKLLRFDAPPSAPDLGISGAVSLRFCVLLFSFVILFRLVIM